MKRIRPHDPRWSTAFLAETEVLKAALGGVEIALHHIGSTAVRGVWAKPIIDIAAAVHRLEELDARRAELQRIGYEALGEHGIPGRRYFRKVSADGEGVHVHAFARGSERIADHIYFRDFLRIRPDLADAYSALKRSLASPDGVWSPTTPRARRRSSKTF
jgi:GrpB-like predicted nucleotidyltransferase (UPF0157 family)